MTLRERAQAFVSGLQDEICAALERFEPSARFREDRWERPVPPGSLAPPGLLGAGGGGGRTRVLTGEVLEKAGVNVSAVWGEVPEALKLTFWVLAYRIAPRALRERAGLR